MSVRRRLISRPTSSFQIYRRQPLVLLAIALWGGRRYVTFGLMVILTIGLPGVVALAQGTFVGDIDFSADAGGLVSGNGLPPKPVEIPYLRDYANLILQLLLCAHAAHMVSQWGRISRLPVLLRKRGLIPDSSIDEATFAGVLDVFERRFNRVAWEVVAAVAGLGLITLIALTVISSGLYPHINDGPGGGSHSVRGWWADPVEHPLAFGLLIAIYWLHLYLFVRHTLMGLVALRLVLHARSLAGPSRPWLAYSSPWRDVLPAIKELRGGLDDVLVSISLLVPAFLVATIYVPLPAALVYGFVLPYVLLNPIFLVIPSIELNRQIEESWHILRSQALKAWSDALARAHAADSRHAAREWLRSEAFRLEYERTLALPRLVIDWTALARGLVVYCVPVFALLPAHI